jgi:putative endonuclease
VRGDVDLIGWDGDCLCFVEVKTRTKRDLSPAESAVDEDKRNMLRGLARAYLRTFPESERRSIPVRFDVVSVYSIGGANEFEVFERAFGWR